MNGAAVLFAGGEWCTHPPEGLLANYFEWTYPRMVLYLKRLKRQTPISMHSGLPQGELGVTLHASLQSNKEPNQGMTKSLEVISEAVRNPKHPFRKVDNQPKKPLKHRYERRKIREYLHLGEWASGEAT
jgi:hypothetical protein